jgi:hypothetical protein
VSRARHLEPGPAIVTVAVALVVGLLAALGWTVLAVTATAVLLAIVALTCLTFAWLAWQVASHAWVHQ